MRRSLRPACQFTKPFGLSQKMVRVLTLLALAIMLVVLPSCADDKPKDPNRVSTIPWNRPEKWEGQGPLGGFSPNSQ